jgi:hypothetical protein
MYLKINFKHFYLIPLILFEHKDLKAEPYIHAYLFCLMTRALEVSGDKCNSCIFYNVPYTLSYIISHETRDHLLVI